MHSGKFILCKATCIWKFAQRQSPYLGFCWRYRRILFGYQARIFYFSFFNVWHKSLSFITWNLIEYLHTQDFQRATSHLNVWTNILFCFVYGCKQHKKNILTESKRRKELLNSNWLATFFEVRKIGSNPTFRCFRKKIASYEKNSQVENKL